MVRYAVLLLLPTLASAQQSFQVHVGRRVVTFQADQWQPMPNPEGFAENFQSLTKRPDEEFEQVVTVFKLPMARSDRVGVEVAAGEFVEFFSVHAGLATVHIRVDCHGFWLQSRRTFRPPPGDWPMLTGHHLFLALEENRRLIATFDAQVKQTRFELHTLAGC